VIDSATFAPRLLAWFDRHGRHDLPWQHPRTPYRTWLAEVMLQQTRVATAIPYFDRFVQALPELPALAAAPGDQVLALWSGLGYYARARNLQQAARICVERHHGELPRDLDALSALPGIGRSTAAAILAQAHGDRHAILDGNVKRLLCRLFAIDGWPGTARMEKALWPLAEALLPPERLADHTQAIMDFGATLCSRAAPACGICPFRSDCQAWLQGRVAELPTARPGKPLPRRECVMLLLQDERGSMLLSRRPPAGVWAGLWSLPQFDQQAQGIDHALRLGGTGEPRALPAFEHVFSHFRLRIRPLHWRVSGSGRIADNDDTRWAAAADLAAIGLPAPVRRLLDATLGGN
jgi:A/G-specific adenine glycosylase